MEVYWGSGDKLHALLTTALDVNGQLHTPAALPPGKEPQEPIG
jgi:hypothetical protein